MLSGRLTQQERRNAFLHTAGESFWGFQTGFVAAATVLAVLLKESFGAGPAFVGSIASIEYASILLPQIVGAYLFSSRRKQKRHLILWHLFVSVPALFLVSAVITASPVLGPVATRWALLAAFAAYTASIGVIIPVWMDWMANLYAVRIRGTVLGLAMCAFATLGACGGLLSGRLIEAFPGTATYAWLYVIAGGMAALAMVFFCFVRDTGAETHTERDRPGFRTLLARFRQSLRERNVRAFLVGRMLATAGFCILPLVAVHFTSEAGGSIGEGRLVTYGAAMGLGTAVAYLVLGRVGDRWGHRLGLIIGAGAQVAGLAVVLSTRGPVGCVFAYAAAGVCAGSGFLSHTNMLFETCPHDHRIAHITIANLVLGCWAIPLPLLAGWVASRWGTPTVFAGCLAFSVLALFWYVFRVREPRYALVRDEAPADPTGGS